MKLFNKYGDFLILGSPSFHHQKPGWRELVDAPDSKSGSGNRVRVRVSLPAPFSTVPLSDAALAVLEQARMLRDQTGLVFPSALRPGKTLSDMTLTKVLWDNGLADRTTVHGLRSTFRDWYAETGKPREIAEAALAHVVPGVEDAYFRSDLFERRRLMAQWGDFTTRRQGDVVRRLQAQ